MLKSVVSLLFLMLFVFTIAIPTTTLLVSNGNVDISVFEDFSEEEEEKNGESNIEFKFQKVEGQVQNTDSKEWLTLLQSPDYCLKTYNKPFINLIFPPPEK